MTFLPPFARQRQLRSRSYATPTEPVTAPASVDEALTQAAPSSHTFESAPETTPDSPVEATPEPVSEVVSEPVEVTSETLTNGEPDLTMTRNQLVVIAESLGVTVSKADNKATILAKIQAAQSGN